MQVNHLSIYKMTAEQTGKSEELYKAIGSFIFKETAKQLKDPKTLILKLKGIGAWHLRRKRMRIVVEQWTDRAKVKTREDFSSDSAYATYAEKHRLYMIFVERLKEYEKYIELRDEVRKKRYETQFLLPPINPEQESE